MNLIKLFQRNKKSYQLDQQGPQQRLATSTREAFVDYLLGRGYCHLANYTLMKYYSVCAPVSDAMDRISKEIARIRPVVQDVKTGEFETDHPVLQLLHAPNAFETYHSLIIRWLTFYYITGDAFMLSTGDIKKEPLELSIANTRSISIYEGSDGYVKNFTLNNTDGSYIYRRNENAGRFRYYNEIANQELYQAKRFASSGTFTPLHGESVLHSVYYEVEQYINSGVHNLSVLLRGGSLSGVFTVKEDMMLTDDQRERLKEELHNFVEGAANAGRVGFFDAPLNYTQMGVSNKDMDFLSLKKETKKVIYDRFNIPAPFYSDEVMTMANRESARLDFYDDAILPAMDVMFAELTQFLMYRYPDSENKVITYDISQIPALEPRKLDQLGKLNKMNLLSTNEQRLVIGYDDIDGGDDILVPNNMVPIGVAGEEPVTASKSEFMDIMRLQQNSDGTRRYTDQEIEQIADQEGLK